MVGPLDFWKEVGIVFVFYTSLVLAPLSLL